MLVKCRNSSNVLFIKHWKSSEFVFINVGLVQMLSLLQDRHFEGLYHTVNLNCI